MHELIFNAKGAETSKTNNNGYQPKKKQMRVWGRGGQKEWAR